jgi:hypothetical protein
LKRGADRDSGAATLRVIEGGAFAYFTGVGRGVEGGRVR